MEATASLDQLRWFGLRAGDVLVTKDSETADDIGVAAFVPESLDGVVCGYHLAVLRPKLERIDPNYLFWSVCGGGMRQQMTVFASGVTRFGLRFGDVGNLQLFVPDLATQRAIARFLDRETARIDALIERRRSLLERLWSRWESEVYRAVKKGLAAAIPMSSSGLEWAGEVPAHWTTPPVYANFDVQLGKMLNAERAAGPYPAAYLRNVNVQWDHIDLSDLATMSFDEADRMKYGLRSGDLLVCEGGEVGRAAIWRGALDECYYQKAVHRVRSRGDCSVRFLMYCLWAAASMNVFNVEGNQATIVHLTAEKLRTHRFPMPPRSEQDAIVEWLDYRQAILRGLAERIERQIERILERRQALITATVTGQTEVPAPAA